MGVERRAERDARRDEGGRTSEEKFPRARAAPLFAPHERLQRLFHRETHGTRGPARARSERQRASVEFFASVSCGIATFVLTFEEKNNNVTHHN
jgi:hypothetical protein